jgi:nitroimidazol reductase NimA-like FMN-containing flavoprotein (pyridoxamine 5'-phosphate oxidase superfamily)
MPLSPAELDEFLAAPRMAHFATVSDDEAPRVRPLWYAYADGAFYFTTRLESRWTGADVTGGSKVAVSIATEERPYRAVVARGTAKVWDEDRESWLERIAIRYGEKEGRAWVRRALEEPDRVVLRMVPDMLVSWDYSKGDVRHQDARPHR